MYFLAPSRHRCHRSFSFPFFLNWRPNFLFVITQRGRMFRCLFAFYCAYGTVWYKIERRGGRTLSIIYCRFLIFFPTMNDVGNGTENEKIKWHFVILFYYILFYLISVNTLACALCDTSMRTYAQQIHCTPYLRYICAVSLSGKLKFVLRGGEWVSGGGWRMAGENILYLHGVVFCEV